MGFLKKAYNRIKQWVTGGSSKSSGSRNNTRSTSRYSTRGDSKGNAARNSIKASSENERSAKEEKLQAQKNKFKASSNSTYKSAAESLKSKTSGQTDIKQKLISDASDKRKQEREDYNKATNNRYNVKGAKTKAEKLKRRQNQKSQVFDSKTTVKEAEHAMKYHRTAESAARGAVSGATFGASDLLEKYGTKGEAKKASEVYQKNKNKSAETAGEIAASLASFGLTGGASKAVVKKALPRTTKFAAKQGAKAAEKLAGTKLVQRAAEKEVANAVKTGLIKEATEDAVKKVAKRKAGELVADLGTDAAVNATTGTVYSATEAAKESKNAKEFGKNFAKNEALNFGIGSAATVGLPAAGRGLKRALGGVSEGAEKALTEAATKAETPRVKVDLGKRKKTEVRIPNTEVRVSNAEEPRVKVDLNRRRNTNVVLPNEQAPKRATARSTTTSDTLDTLRDPIVSASDKRSAWLKRIDELKREYDDALPIAKQGDERAAQRVEEIRNEVKELNGAMKEVDNGSAETALRDEVTAEPRKTVNQEIENSLSPETQEKWTKAEDRNPLTAKEAEELRAEDWRTTEEHTKKGGTTLAAGMGNREYRGEMEKAIHEGDLTIEVYHDKENYAKGAERVLAYAEGRGGTTGKQNLESLVEKFTKYADGDEAVTSRQARDMLYDILAATDYANSLSKDEATRDLGERLFLSATKAGAELTSVSGLSLRQWQKIAMSSPDYRSKAVKQQIANMFEQSRGFRKRYGQLVGGMKRLRDGARANEEEALDAFIRENPEVSQRLSAELDSLMGATSKEEVEEAASRVILEARKIMPVTAFDQLTQWRYIAMLSSPTTHVKNVVGNIYSGTLGQISGAISSSIEQSLIKQGKVNAKVDIERGAAAGDEYLKSAKGFSVAARNDARVGVAEGIKLDNLRSKLSDAERELRHANDTDKVALQKKVADLKGRVAQAQKNFDGKKVKNVTGAKAQELYHTKSKETLIKDAEKWVMNGGGVGGKALGKASNFIGMALETSDAVAVERIYRETADKVLRANGYEKWLKLAAGEGKAAAAAKSKVKQIEEYAAQHAAYKASLDTYRNYNAVASWINKTVKNNLYNADAKWYQRVGGFTLHAVMPFTKVPTNILKRSIDYSPVGLIQGKKMLNQALKSGDYVEINKAVERLSEGLVGTGIAGLGMGLGALDPDGMTITTRLDRNSELDKKKKDRGYMDYSVKLGNKDFTLEWATPTASTFFVGVEVGRMLRNICDNAASENGLEFDLGKSLGVFEEVMSTIVEPTMQLTMFQGINTLLEDSMTKKYNENNVSPVVRMALNIPKNYFSSLTPSLMSRMSRAFAPYDYYISGATTLEYRKNLAISKIPIVSKNMLDARTNEWGEIRNERKTVGDKVLNAVTTLASPMNVSNITWDKTDTKMFEMTKELGGDIMPKNYYGEIDEDGKFTNDISLGRNKKNTLDLTLTNNDKAQYNIARGKSGEDAMHAALESVIFNRWYKDEKGKYTIEGEGNYTPEMKAEKIAEFKGKSLKDAVVWVMSTDEFKNATPAEQKQILKNMVGNGSTDTSQGAKRASELTVAKRHKISTAEYDYKNEVPQRVQQQLDGVIDSGLLTYEQVVDYCRNAGKTYYRTDANGEEGGTVTTYYNKKEMIAYLQEKGYSYEQSEALYNAFKKSDAKPFSGLSSSGRGRRRRGYRRRGGGGSSTKPVPIKQSDFKASKAKYEDSAAGLGTKSSSSKKKKSSSKKSKTVKVEPPKVKFKKYEV